MKIKKIGIISLAGPCDEKDIIEAKNYFESKSFEVVLSNNIFDKNNYLSGSDDIKIKELYRFFEDDSIDLILNARGGYGSIRLINDIDYEIIKKNPKPFCGFSDITALLLMFYKKSGLTTYHSPMAVSDFTEQSLRYREYNYENLFKALCEVKQTLYGNNVFNSASVNGIIWGGNLSTVVSLCGLDFIPTEDFIFFTEDLNEPVYKIDKMFQQLFNIYDFKKSCKGIVLGDFLNIDNPEWLNNYFYELSKKYNIPIVSGFKITHSQEKITIPIGSKCRLDDFILTIG